MTTKRRLMNDNGGNRCLSHLHSFPLFILLFPFFLISIVFISILFNSFLTLALFFSFLVSILYVQIATIVDSLTPLV